jgi:hypothetical protein
MDQVIPELEQRRKTRTNVPIPALEPWMEEHGVTTATVKVSNFEPHGNFGQLLHDPSNRLWVKSVKKLNRTKFADLNYFSNSHPIYFSVGHVLMLASLSEKGKKKKVVYTGYLLYTGAYTSSWCVP